VSLFKKHFQCLLIKQGIAVDALEGAALLCLLVRVMRIAQDEQCKQEGERERD